MKASPASKTNNGEVERFSLFLVFPSKCAAGSYCGVWEHCESPNSKLDLTYITSQVDDNEGDMAVNIDSMGSVFPF